MGVCTYLGIVWRLPICGAVTSSPSPIQQGLFALAEGVWLLLGAHHVMGL